jgi:hypothetical protein
MGEMAITPSLTGSERGELGGASGREVDGEKEKCDWHY